MTRPKRVRHPEGTQWVFIETALRLLSGFCFPSQVEFRKKKTKHWTALLRTRHYSQTLPALMIQNKCIQSLMANGSICEIH